MILPAKVFKVKLSFQLDELTLSQKILKLYYATLFCCLVSVCRVDMIVYGNLFYLYRKYNISLCTIKNFMFIFYTIFTLLISHVWFIKKIFSEILFIPFLSWILFIVLSPRVSFLYIVYSSKYFQAYLFNNFFARNYWSLNCRAFIDIVFFFAFLALSSSYINLDTQIYIPVLSLAGMRITNGFVISLLWSKTLLSIPLGLEACCDKLDQYAILRYFGPHYSTS